MCPCFHYSSVKKQGAQTCFYTMYKLIVYTLYILTSFLDDSQISKTCNAANKT
jgi:hypothetical protein